MGVILFDNTDGLVQDYSNSNALAMELLQSYTKPLILSNTRFIWYSNLDSVDIELNSMLFLSGRKHQNYHGHGSMCLNLESTYVNCEV